MCECPFPCLMNSFRKKDSQYIVYLLKEPNTMKSHGKLSKSSSRNVLKSWHTVTAIHSCSYSHSSISRKILVNGMIEWDEGVLFLFWYISSVEPLGRHHSLCSDTYCRFITVVARRYRLTHSHTSCTFQGIFYLWPCNCCAALPFLPFPIQKVSTREQQIEVTQLERETQDSNENNW